MLRGRYDHATHLMISDYLEHGEKAQLTGAEAVEAIKRAREVSDQYHSYFQAKPLFFIRYEAMKKAIKDLQKPEDALALKAAQAYIDGVEVFVPSLREGDNPLGVPLLNTQMLFMGLFGLIVFRQRYALADVAHKIKKTVRRRAKLNHKA